jgi:hypothetical protein
VKSYLTQIKNQNVEIEYIRNMMKHIDFSEQIYRYVNICIYVFP